jgi:hypothetical protein
MMGEHIIVVHMNNSNPDDCVLTARAASYLAYADTTNTLAYLAEIVDAHAYQHRSTCATQVDLTYNIPVLSPNDQARFSDEMNRLSRVVQHIHHDEAVFASN